MTHMEYPMNLRSKLIRLAAHHPELRGHLLPLLAKTAAAKSYKVIKDIKWKDGSVTAKGTQVTVQYQRDKPQYAKLVADGDQPRSTKITSLHAFLQGYPKQPSTSQLQKWEDAGTSKTPSGQTVEPDGVGTDGAASWLLILGMI